MKHSLSTTGCIYLLSAMVSSATCNKDQAPAVNQPSSTPKQGLTLKADGPGSTYELIASAFGGDPLEDPDCADPSFGRHVSEVFDPVLQKNAFVFIMHVTPDNDAPMLVNEVVGYLRRIGTAKTGVEGRLVAK